ncbi:MAG: hypothetical protein QM751_09590 [Paludibacteraceae bacterium]
MTEEQKTIIRRDYLYSHLTDRTTTVADAKGSILQAFAKQHLPEQTTKIETERKEEYGKKNARLDERIAGLKKADKKAKAEAKTKKQEQPAQAEKAAKSDKKQPKKAEQPTEATTTAVAVIPKVKAVAVAQPA